MRGARLTASKSRDASLLQPPVIRSSNSTSTRSANLFAPRSNCIRIHHACRQAISHVVILLSKRQFVSTHFCHFLFIAGNVGTRCSSRANRRHGTKEVVQKKGSDPFPLCTTEGDSAIFVHSHERPRSTLSNCLLSFEGPTTKVLETERSAGSLPDEAPCVLRVALPVPAFDYKIPEDFTLMPLSIIFSSSTLGLISKASARLTNSLVTK